MTQFKDDGKPFQFNWQPQGTMSTTANNESSLSTDQHSTQFKFFSNNSEPNANQIQSSKADNIINSDSIKWNQFNFTFDEDTSFTVDFKHNENNNINNNTNNDHDSMNVSLSNLCIKSSKKLDFEQIATLTDTISSVET
eukprot:18933_1